MGDDSWWAFQPMSVSELEGHIQRGVDVNQVGRGLQPLHKVVLGYGLKNVPLPGNSGPPFVETLSPEAPALADLLLRNGADPNGRTDDGEAPLALVHRTIRGSQPEAVTGTVAVLIDHGADPFVIDIQGLTLLHRAAWHGSEELVNLLLSHGLPIDSSRGFEGVSPLHYAVHRVGNARLLIDRGADVNHQDNWGSTPLHTAASLHSVASVQLLLSAGAEVNAIATGKTPLVSAVCDRLAGPQTPDVVALLLAAGADQRSRQAALEIVEQRLYGTVNPEAHDAFEKVRDLLTRNGETLNGVR